MEIEVGSLNLQTLSYAESGFSSNINAYGGGGISEYNLVESNSFSFQVEWGSTLLSLNLPVIRLFNIIFVMFPVMELKSHF